MTTFIAVAYYEVGGKPKLIITDKFQDVLRFMSENPYMQNSVYQKDNSGITLLEGKDITGS